MSVTRRLILLSIYFITAIPTSMPAQQSFWQKTNGPYGTMANVVRTDSVGDIFVGTLSMGIYCSTDNGSTWNARNNGLPIGASVSDIIFGPWNRIYTVAIGAGSSNGAYMSNDGGSTWTKMAGTPSSGHAMARSQDGMLYLAADDGFYRKDIGIIHGSRIWERPGNTEPALFSSLAVNSLGWIFAGSTNGVYKSTNAGVTWTKASAPIVTSVSTLYIDDNDSLYVGTSSGIFSSNGASSGGTTWISRGPTGKDVDAIIVDTYSNLYAGTSQGIFASAPEGVWYGTEDILKGRSILSLARDDNDNILATTREGLFRSGDFAVTWESINTGIESGIQDVVANTQGDLFAANYTGVQKSTDNGASWTLTGALSGYALKLGINQQGVLFVGGYFGVSRSIDSGRTWQTTSSALSPHHIKTTSNGRVVFASRQSIFVSPDTGKTWFEKKITNRSSGIRSIAISSSDQMAALTEDEVFISTDGGGAWQYAGGGWFTDNDFKELTYGTNGKLYISFSNGLLLSSDGFKSVFGIPSTFGGYLVDATVNKDGWIFVIQGNLRLRILYSNNDAEIWNDASEDLGGATITSMAWVSNSHLAVGTSDGLYITTIGTSLAPGLIVVKDVPLDQGGYVNIRWDASYLDMQQVNDLSYYSVWRALPRYGGLGGASSSSISLKSSTPQVSGITPKIRISGGRAWEWLGNVPGHNFGAYSFTAKTVFDSTSVTPAWHYFIVSAHTSDEKIFFDSSIDSGYSVDNLGPKKVVGVVGKASGSNFTLNWSPSPESDLWRYVIYRSTSPNLSAQNLTPYAYANDTTFLDAGARSNSRYVYAVKAQDIHENLSPFSSEVSFGITGIETNGQEIPASFGLSQNYPNPFNPSTTISFQLPAPSGVEGSAISHVTLKVYDMLGKQVATLVSHELQAGYYSTKWVADVPSGVYLYRIEAIEASSSGKRFVETRKMILLR